MPRALHTAANVKLVRSRVLEAEIRVLLGCLCLYALLGGVCDAGASPTSQRTEQRRPKAGNGPKPGAELPVRGVFGDPRDNGCRSYRNDEEGAYVSFNQNGGTGEGGEGGCDYSVVRRTSSSAYSLIGTCTNSGGGKTRRKTTLIVKNQDELVYAGVPYRRCS